MSNLSKTPMPCPPTSPRRSRSAIPTSPARSPSTRCSAPRRPRLRRLRAGHGQVAITELEGGASVNDLVVHNQGAQPVLLYEGEEILGAQQNRVLDISILVAAEAKTQIPVSCVEQGAGTGAATASASGPPRRRPTRGCGG